MTDLGARKAAARTRAYAIRQAAFAMGQGRAAAILAEVLRDHAGKPLSGYMPMRCEIDPLPAMALHEGPVGVPVIIAKATPLQFRAWTATAPMVEGPFGTRMPERGDWIVPQVLIVPLLAFDRRGYRLGYGGGFYDRTLQGLRQRGPVVAIGFAFAAQEVGEVPVDATDQRLDIVVTEVGVVVGGKALQFPIGRVIAAGCGKR